ncbi:MAG: ferredoxin--NADP reductase [Chromatiales bacterium]|nr:ferredoxin--NADP reductase [Chromatiales bacterium]
MTILRSSFIEGEVIENKTWTERLYSLRIRVELMPFKAGQFVRLQLPVGGEVVTKSYSLINAPDEPDLEVFFNTVPNGRLSNALAALRGGDRIEVSQPAQGFFVLDEIPETRHLWMFATGTGLGPYISILKTADVWKRFEKVVLVHGVPLMKELAYADLIGTWQQKYPDQFRFVSCVTREQNSAGLHGRMTDLFVNDVLEKQIGLEISKDNSHVMLCGNHNMIKDMKALLAERGMSRHLRHKPGQVTTEQYY